MLCIQERRKPNWEFLKTQNVALSFSGGMDSTAVLVLALRNGVNLKALSISGETDHPESARYCAEICELLGVELIDITIPDSFKYFVKCINTCNDYLSAFRKFYNRQYHNPMRKLLARNNFAARLVGYRADEYQWHMGQISFAPIFNWSKSQVTSFLKQNSIPLHPCYSQTDFLKQPIRESSWIDMQYYGLFHLADRGSIRDEAIITLKWLKRYYAHLYELVLQSFDLQKMGYAIER